MPEPTKYEQKTYRNVPQNNNRIEEAQEQGYEIYERNARDVRLRREFDGDPEDAETPLYTA